MNNYNVIVAGGGNAGLCAAICAARRGVSVCVIDAAPKAWRGGNTRHTRNMRVAHEAGNGILTGPYPVDEYLDDLLRVTAGNTDNELARMTIEKSAELWDFLSEQGVHYQPSLGGTLSLGRTNAFFLGGGRSMLNALYRTAEALGVTFLYDSKVTSLAINDGYFESLELLQNWQGDSPTEITLSGRAFIAAAGGFEANIEWLTEAWGDAANNFLIRGTPYNRGLVLRKLLDAGVASVGDPKQCHAVAIDGRAPKFDGGIVTRLDCVPFGIVLNANGQRFYDEGEDFWPKRYAIWGRLVAAQPEQTGFVLIDTKSIDLFMPSVFPPLKADSIAELANLLGLPEAQTQATVDEFNAACTGSSFDHTAHDDCRTEGISPAKSHWARPIDKPPFYAYTLKPGITFTYLGVKVDSNARMVMQNGKQSPNMFAAGEIMAGNVLGEGYLAGIGMTIGSVFGRIAGDAAARQISNAIVENEIDDGRNE